MLIVRRAAPLWKFVDFLFLNARKFQNFILGGSAHNRDIGYNRDSSSNSVEVEIDLLDY